MPGSFPPGLVAVKTLSRINRNGTRLIASKRALALLAPEAVIYLNGITYMEECNSIEQDITRALELAVAHT
jgi:hypothetical protein